MTTAVELTSFASAYKNRNEKGSLWQVLDPITSAARSYRVWFCTTCVLAAIVAMCTFFAMYSIGELVHISGAGSDYKTSTSIVLGIAVAGIFVVCGLLYVDFVRNDFTIMTGSMTLYSTLSDSVFSALDSIGAERIPEFLGRFGPGIDSIAALKTTLFPRLAPRPLNMIVLCAAVSGFILSLAAVLLFASNYMTALFIGLIGVCLIFVAVVFNEWIHVSGYNALIRDLQALRAIFVGEEVAAFYADSTTKVRAINSRFNSLFTTLLSSSQLLADAAEGIKGASV